MAYLQHMTDGLLVSQTEW